MIEKTAAAAGAESYSLASTLIADVAVEERRRTASRELLYYKSADIISIPPGLSPEGAAMFQAQLKTEPLPKVSTTVRHVIAAATAHVVLSAAIVAPAALIVPPVRRRPYHLVIISPRDPTADHDFKFGSAHPPKKRRGRGRNAT